MARFVDRDHRVRLWGVLSAVATVVVTAVGWVPVYECRVTQGDGKIVIELSGKLGILGILLAGDARPWQIVLYMFYPRDPTDPWATPYSTANPMLHLKREGGRLYGRTVRLTWGPGPQGQFVLEGKVPKSYQVLEGPKMLQRGTYYELKADGPCLHRNSTPRFFLDADGRVRPVSWRELYRALGYD